jgi:carbohydrate-binding DOMON domain-containing protein
MKHIKTFENINEPEYIITYFFSADDDNDIMSHLFMLRITKMSENYLEYDKYYYYEKIDRFNRRLFSFSNGNIWNYNNYNNTLKIIYKTNSEQDALNRLKEILDSDSIQSGILFSTKYNI